MPRDSLRSTLRRLFTPARRADREDHRSALEADLLEQFDRRFPEPPPRPARWPKFALATAMFSVAVVGACRFPAEYAVDMGARIGIVVDAAALEGLDPKSIVRFVGETYPLDHFDAAVSKQMQRVEGEQSSEITIRLDMVSDTVDIDSDVLWEQLQEEFPQLHNAARLEEEQLEATVQGTVGGKLSHRMMDVIIDRHGVEEARRQLLEQLQRRGFEGTAHIEVHEQADGKRRIKVEVRAEGTTMNEH